MASGTISGAERGSEGSLIELTQNGAEPVRLANGSERTFLEDGDEVVLRGRAANGVELGEVRGSIAPAR
jgi:fumarylacetoacetase